MILNVETIEGYGADLLVINIIKSLLAFVMEDTFDDSGLLEEIPLNEITILTGGNDVVKVLQSANGGDSKKHIYVVTKTEQEASIIETTLLYWVKHPENLRAALTRLDPELASPSWEEYFFESIAADISDMLATSVYLRPGEVSRKCFKGIPSWVDS